MASPTALRRARLSTALAFQARASGDPLEIRDIRLYPLREPSSGRLYTLVRLETRSGLRVRRVPWREPARFQRGPPHSRGYSRECLRNCVAPNGRRAVDPARRRYGAARPAGGGRRRLRPTRCSAGPPGLRYERWHRSRARRCPSWEPRWIAHESPDIARSEFPLRRRPGPTRDSRLCSRSGRPEILRKAAGDTADFVLDGGARLSAGDAGSLSAEFERYHLLWLDEPCGVSSLGAIRKLANERVTPIGFGRNFDQPSAFQDLLREEAADVVRPNLALHGVSQIRRIAALAETYYVAVAPFHDGGPLATAAALHLAASLPNFFIQQAPVPANDQDRQMRTAITGVNVEAPVNGFFALPTGPGLGVEINERALDRYKERA